MTDIVETQHDMTPSGMIQLAIEKGADPDFLEKLMALKERHDANEAKKAYVKAMNSFRNECPAIIKTKIVDYSTSKGQTHYTHADLCDTLEQIKPILIKNGLHHSWRTDSNGTVKVTCVVTHEQGHSESTTLTGPSDNSGGKNAIQAIGSSVTYLERYTLFALLGLASKDDDDGNGAGDPVGEITQEQGQELLGMIRDTGADLDRFLAHFGISMVERLPANRYAEAKKLLEAKQKRKTA